jgi:hypothetical protein
VENSGSVKIVDKEVFSFDKKQDFPSNTSLGFKAIIPKYKVSIPSFTIEKFPFFNEGCNNLKDEKWPLICGVSSFETKKACKKVAGIKVCVPYVVAKFEKRLNEIYIDSLSIPEQVLFVIPETILEFKFQMLPTLEVIKKITSSVSLSLYPLSPPGGLLSFEISKFLIGFELNINRLQFTHGGVGIKLQNLRVPLLQPIDYLVGKTSLTSSISSTGDLKLSYLITTFTLSLYDILIVAMNAGIMANAVNILIVETAMSSGSPNPNAPGASNSGARKLIEDDCPEIILNFLKNTSVVFEVMLLVCPGLAPASPYFFSLVVTAKTTLKPFQGLNLIKIPDKIPTTTNIPEIPNIKLPSFLGSGFLNKIINDINKIDDDVLKVAGKKLLDAAEYIKNNYSNIEISAKLQGVLPIVPNPPA